MQLTKYKLASRLLITPLLIGMIMMTASCDFFNTGKTVEDVIVIDSTKSIVSFRIMPNMQVVGEAAQFKDSWVNFANYTSQLESMDHSILSVQRLQSESQLLASTLPVELTNERILARITTLETKTRFYQQYFSGTNVNEQFLEDYYQEVITAYDNLVLQLNENFFQMDYRDNADAPGSIIKLDRDNYLPDEENEEVPSQETPRRTLEDLTRQ